MILHFSLCEDPVIVTGTFPSTLCTPHAVWLYEEFDVDRRGRYTFDVLLSNGWEIKLRFRDFQFLIGEQILQARNGEVSRTAGATLSRPA